MITEELLAQALALAEGGYDADDLAERKALIESLYAPGTSWLDITIEWFETPRELAAKVAAIYADLERR